MTYLRARIARELIDYFGSDNHRIEHALRVLHHSEVIMLQYPSADLEIIIAAALLHDVGIKPSDAILGYNDGKTQEQYGPEKAQKILQRIHFSPEKTCIVCNIIGNHHSPSRYDYIELEILKQADRIVNKAEALEAKA